MSFKELLAREFAPYRTLSEQQVNALEEHWELMLRWNKALNLTRITSMEDAVRLHYCESLYLATRLPAGPLSILDAGSGPGFPGVPVAVLRPECAVTLAESHQRKAVFLREASRHLPNVSVFSGRAADAGGSFDWIVSRAVSPDEVFKLHNSNNFALLVGRSHGGERLPWGDDRFLLTVPRGTSGTSW